ncbi:PLAC8 family protein [Zostera marina]|uniref:PLAC8 family protein n=1 Tax=Zostera marina TaxID=29655 RepID=A0A0K9NX48_ZOSMR|nr:PLAC8 family protein [Zostera marina]
MGEVEREMKLIDFIPIDISCDEESSIFKTKKTIKIHWKVLIKFCKRWIRNPMNMAILLWLSVVGLLLLLFLLLITGFLNQIVPVDEERKKWVEIDNQILNALFTIMCLYQHPRLIHHILFVISWKDMDIVALRKLYCWYPTTRPRERLHLTVVVVLVNLTCVAQYFLCALYWGYSSTNRPGFAVDTCLALGVTVPMIAAVYTFLGPLSWKYTEVVPIDAPVEKKSLNQEWKNDAGITTCVTSFFCTFCMFGWNMQRLGFGNMYVHTITFLLLCTSPLFVFYIASLKMSDDMNLMKRMTWISGTVLSFFGLFYGGFWRSHLRRKLKLPAYTFCLGHPTATDFVQWLFCWSCSLAQEVRTGSCLLSEKKATVPVDDEWDDAVVAPPIPWVMT